jgi:hypothetical protein
MTITTNPASARTDLPAHAGKPHAPTTTQARRVGVGMTAGALCWAAGLFTVGAVPATELGVTIGDLSALPFQLGLFALVWLQLRTRATGTSRAAMAMLRVEYVLLALASAWTILHGAVPAFRDDLWLVVLDVFWPLSMLGMFVIGVKIAFAGRWRGPARIWPLVAESWAVVTIPATVVFGQGATGWVGGAHLLIGYAGLGILLALRPRLTGAHD